MELRHLRYFVMAAEEQNISRAAARLHISQPAVSRQIRDLEEELGVKLFDREQNGLRLTEAGQFALNHSRELLRQSNAMKNALQAFTADTKRMGLKIGYIPTALPGFLANSLRQFNEQHQHVCVEIQEMTPGQQERALKKGEIDLALLGSPCMEWTDRYRIEALREVPMAVALPDDHPLAHTKAVDLADLSSETFLTLHESQFPGRPELMKDLFQQAGLRPKFALKVQGLSELLGHIGAGAGIALVPSDVDQLPHARVVILPLKWPRTTLVSSAVWRADEETKELLDLVALLKAT